VQVCWFVLEAHQVEGAVVTSSGSDRVWCTLTRLFASVVTLFGTELVQVGVQQVHFIMTSSYINPGTANSPTTWHLDQGTDQDEYDDKDKGTGLSGRHRLIIASDHVNGVP